MSAIIDINSVDCCKECASVCDVVDICEHGIGNCCFCEDCLEENAPKWCYENNKYAICRCPQPCEPPRDDESDDENDDESDEDESDDESDEISVASDINTDVICKNCDLRFYDILLTDKEKHGDWCHCSVTDIMK
jgi:hypothetical protein